MNIETVVVGDLDTNCYLVYDPLTKDAIVIDPGDQADKILATIKDKELKPLYIVHTHAHPDHFGATEEIRKATGAKVVIHESDAMIIESRILSLRGALFDPVKVDVRANDGDVLDFGGMSLQVIHTPGHSMGCICLYSEKEKLLFSGDTLFFDAVGRTDLPGSSTEDMRTSLKKLLRLSPDAAVYPGHGRATTIAQEKENLGDIK